MKRHPRLLHKIIIFQLFLLYLGIFVPVVYGQSNPHMPTPPAPVPAQASAPATATVPTENASCSKKEQSFFGSVVFPSVVISLLQKTITYPLEVMSTRNLVLDNIDQRNVQITKQAKSNPFAIAQYKQYTKGFCFSFFFGGLKNASLLIVNKTTSDYLDEKFKGKNEEEGKKIKFFNKLGAGAMAGASEIIWNPANVIKQDLQTDKYKTVAESLKNRSLSSYFNGAGACLGRNITYQSITLTCLGLNPLNNSEDSKFLVILYGAGVGALGNIISWPWEYVRAMKSIESSGKSPSAYTIYKNTLAANPGFFPFCQRIYRGIGPSILKMGTQTAILAPLFQIYFQNK